MSKYHGRAVPVSVSQNFLTSQKIINRLLRLTSINKCDTVLEIGAGKGHITKALLCKCNRVIASEIDVKLFESLCDKFSGHSDVHLMNNDFLQSNLPQSEYKVFSNIPFSITTDIIRKLTQDKNPPLDAWLVMEKGAAKRFCGKPNDTLQSLLLRPYFNLRIVYYFRREDFHPAPCVDVTLLHISQKIVPDLLWSEQKAYRDFVSHGLKFGLFGKQALLTKHQISVALRLAKLNPIQPDSEVLYIQWLCLFRCWLKHGKS